MVAPRKQGLFWQNPYLQRAALRQEGGKRALSEESSFRRLLVSFIPGSHLLRGGGEETPLPVKKAIQLKLGSHPFSILISFGSCFLLCYTALKLQLAAHNSTHFNIRTLYQSLSLWCFSKTDWITWISLKIMFLFYHLLSVLLRWPGYL